MSAQRHVIQRQTLEITLAKKAQAWELQQTLSRIFQRQVPAVLDRCLSEVSSADYVHRIERLELDLGEFDSDFSADELLARIEASLRQALGEQISQTQTLPTAQQNEPVRADLELFEHFIQQGYLPWWADSRQSRLPETSFTTLVNTKPLALTRLLAKLIQQPRSLQRLISYFNDRHLLTITALLSGAAEDLPTALMQILSAVQAPLHQYSRVPTSRLRAACRQSLLQVAVTGSPVITQHADFLMAVTLRWAKLLGLPHPLLISHLQHLLLSPAVVDNEWLQAIRLSTPVTDSETVVAEKPSGNRYAQLKKIGEDAGRTPPLTIPPSADDLATRLIAKNNRYPDDQATIEAADNNRLAVSDDEIGHPGTHQLRSTTLSHRYAQLKIINVHDAGHTPMLTNPPLVGDLATRLSATSNRAPAAQASIETADNRPTFSDDEIGHPGTYRLRSIAFSHRYARLKIINVHDAGHTPTLTNPPSAGDLATRLSAKNNRVPDDRAGIKPADKRPAFSDADALYINNAGLCLLWPFLGAFFESLELMQNGRFHDLAARQCAVSLLHYLATEELNPPEYRLPFNKLLCAMDISEVFDFDTPLSALQIEACDALLLAVIDQAPILNNMSINGFRGSFLLRPGSLSANQGGWLLRVERETYDLVLARFPWTWQWVNLPWMAHPLRVEW